jgi:fibronectin-binding autotransporter adhesin
MAYKFQSGEAILSGALKQEGTISGSGDVTLAVGKDFNIAGSNVLNLTTLGSSVAASSLTSVGTLTGLTASSPIVGPIKATALSSSGELQLGAGQGIDIGGATVLSAATLGTGVLGSSLTSVGTLSSLNVGAVTSTGIVSSSNDGRFLALDINSNINVIDSSANFSGGTVTANGAISGSGDLTLGAGSGIDIAGTANVLTLTGLGSTVLASSLTSVGTLAGVTSSSPIVGPLAPTAFSGAIGVSGSSAKFSGIVNAGRFVGDGGGISGITADLVDVTSSTGDFSYKLAFVETLGTGMDLGGNASLAFNPRGLLNQFSASLILSGTNDGFQMSQIVLGSKNEAAIKFQEDSGYTLTIGAPGAGIDISGSTESGVALYGGDASGAGVWIQGDQGLTVTDAAENTVATIDKNGNISGSGDLRLGAGAGIDIAGTANVLALAGLGSTVLASSLTSVGTLVGVTSSQPIVASAGVKAAGNLSGSSTLQIAGAASFNSYVYAKGKFMNDNAEISAAGVISGSGDLTLGVGSDVNIAGSNVLNLTTLGSSVLASSLTSVGTLVGMTSSQPIVASAGVKAAGDISGSGEFQAAGAAEFNSTLSVNGAITLAGASDTAVAVGSDSIYFRDADGTMKRDSIVDLVAAMAGTGLSAGSGQLSLSSVGTVTAVGDANATLTEGLTYGSTTLTANRTWTLPASSGMAAGDVIRIKAPADVGAFYIKVTGSGGLQSIDAGDAELYVESDAGAIALHYVATDKFVIF